MAEDSINTEVIPHTYNNAEARQYLGHLRGNNALLRSLINSWIELVRSHPRSNGEIVIGGYCFGGTTALEAARSGTKLAGTVAFHAGLDTENREDAKNIKTPVVVYHGQIDPFVSAESVAAFHKEMTDAKVDYQFISFGHAVHAFTVPHLIKAGAAEYHEPSDKRSWGYFVQFLAETFAPKQSPHYQPSTVPLVYRSRE